MHVAWISNWNVLRWSESHHEHFLGRCTLILSSTAAFLRRRLKSQPSEDSTSSCHLTLPIQRIQSSPSSESRPHAFMQSVASNKLQYDSKSISKFLYFGKNVNRLAFQTSIFFTNIIKDCQVSFYLNALWKSKTVASRPMLKVNRNDKD